MKEVCAEGRRKRGRVRERDWGLGREVGTGKEGTCGRVDRKIVRNGLQGLGVPLGRAPLAGPLSRTRSKLGNEDGPGKLRRLVRIGPRHRNTSPDGSAGTSGQSPGC